MWRSENASACILHVERVRFQPWETNRNLLVLYNHFGCDRDSKSIRTWAEFLTFGALLRYFVK